MQSSPERPGRVELVGQTRGRERLGDVVPRERAQLADLLKRVQDAIAATPVPLVVKIAPDATEDDLDDIVAVCRELRIDGIIVGNTTLSRPPSLRSAKPERLTGFTKARSASASWTSVRSGFRRKKSRLMKPRKKSGLRSSTHSRPR